jgi:DNA-binding transcriptional ArsR family regulator
MSARRRKAPAKASIPGSAVLFAALGDETRLLIVARLSVRGPLSIAGLTAGTGVTRQAVTKHLQVLSNVGLVHGRREGRESVWELEPEQLRAARQSLDRISAQWDEGLGRLKRFVE